MALSNSQYDHLMRTYEQKQLDIRRARRYGAGRADKNASGYEL